MVVDVDDAPVPVAESHGETFDRATVERIQGRSERRRTLSHKLGRQELPSQRQIDARVGMQQRRDTELAEEVEHAGGRPHGVAVGILGDGERDLRLATHGFANRIELRRAHRSWLVRMVAGLRVAGHPSSTGSPSSPS